MHEIAKRGANGRRWVVRAVTLAVVGIWLRGVADRYIRRRVALEVGELMAFYRLTREP